MDFTNALLIGALVYTFVRFLKNLSAFGDPAARSSAVTQLIAWGAGLGAVFLVSSAHLLGGLDVVTIGKLSVPVNKLGIVDKIVAGLVVASSLGVVNDVIGAIDRTRSTAVPGLSTVARPAPAAQPEQPAA